MKLITSLLILALSTSSLASGYLVTLGSGVTIDKIHAHGNGAITLWVNPASLSNPDGCGGTDKVHIKAVGNYQTIVSVALTAYTANKKLGLWSTGCEIIPFWGGSTTFPIVNNVWITD